MYKQTTAVLSCMAAEYVYSLKFHASKECDRASCFDVNTVLLEPDRLLDTPVSSHPDMIICSLGDKLFVPSHYYYNEYKDTVLRIAGAGRLIPVPLDTDRGSQYPKDIGFNVLVMPHHIFSLTEHTAPEILAEAERLGLISVRVKQGYTACSSLAVGECIISADLSVLRAAELCGYDTLRIREGGVRLDGYGCGFIGGASGVCGNTVYFFGNIMLHPDGKLICEKLSYHGFKCVSLSKGELVDFGGIKFF